MSHTYVSLTEFKTFVSRTGTTEDANLLLVLETCSRQIESLASGRQFFPTVKTVYFGGNGKATLSLPGWDIISISSLKEDTNRDATYETTWAATDYLLGPRNHDPASLTDPQPYWILEVDDRSTGNQDAWLKGQDMYEMVGKFGICEITESTGAIINEGAEYSSSDTTLTAASGSGIHIGHTLLIESEQLYVTAISGNNLTVQRGMNGTTAAAHADGTAISKYVYPEMIKQAVLMRADQLMAGRRGGYTDQMPLPDGGSMPVQFGVTLEVRQFLDRYKIPGAY